VTTAGKPTPVQCDGNHGPGCRDSRCPPGVLPRLGMVDWAGGGGHARSPWPATASSAHLLGEIELLRRERDELWDLVSSQEAELEAEAEAAAVGCDCSPLSPGGFGLNQRARVRSLERRLEQDRLVAAQEATATSHPEASRTAAAVGAAAGAAAAAAAGVAAAASRRRPCGCTGAGALPPPPPEITGVSGPRSPTAPCCCEAAMTHGPRTARMRATSESRGPSATARGRGGNGAGVPAVRVPHPAIGTRTAAGDVTPMRYNDYSDEIAKGAGMPLRPPTRPRLQGAAAPGGTAGRLPAPLSRKRPEVLHENLDEAIVGLGSARGALADAAWQIGHEARRRGSEAWRMQRLEHAVQVGLGGLGREIRALRAESSRWRQHGCCEQQRGRCRSCPRY